jgi:hypothetical protein
MSVSDKARLVAILSSSIPLDILNALLDEYSTIKQHFFLRKFQPTELNGARFCECVLRLLQHLNTGAYTPFGNTLNTQAIITATENNNCLTDTLRLFIPRLVRVVLDVRNKRDVAHVGGEVNPNHSDALFVVHAVDWILTELVRHYHSCTVEEARLIVERINEVKVPIIAEVDGFLRIQNTKLPTRDVVLAFLYHKNPEKVSDTNLCKWTGYKNSTRFKEILRELHKEAMIHYEGSQCTLLTKGIMYVEKYIPTSILV